MDNIAIVPIYMDAIFNMDKMLLIIVIHLIKFHAFKNNVILLIILTNTIINLMILQIRVKDITT